MLDTITLKCGSHDAASGNGCLLEWASYLAREPWSDRPECVSPAIGAFGRSWNDALGTDDDRDRLLKPFLPQTDEHGQLATPAQRGGEWGILNTRTTDEDEQTRSSLLYEWSPIQFVQVRAGVRVYDGIPQNDNQNRTQAFLQLHGFF